ncbi:nodulation outer protein NopA; precursor of type III secretion pilus subunit (plasmid) [Sinorhizobium fredii NGR234]|uniref:Nodulation outer protein NopA of type III secretion pilus subunit n=1 Tax=Sinorhizobium fredii (strain NBRC 101917 / NGR234) TaxID=394 RepID=C4ALD0_SINFN|nr:nodulation outer protein NopA; precursor of type III secretion pilus subunit [Sinorhizobium fredii NGR234]
MSKIGTLTSAVGAGAAAGQNVAAKGAGAAAFQAQIAELAAVSAEATARSMLLRTVTTELQTTKKAADERVQ